MERASHSAIAATRAAIRFVQRGGLPPLHNLKAEQVEFTGGNAPTAACATCGVDIRQPTVSERPVRKAKRCRGVLDGLDAHRLIQCVGAACHGSLDASPEPPPRPAAHAHFKRP